ncbi:ornithine cyclodeaminase family protein [Shewanella sp. JM162201]|uniref:Ornithine cyclodeaminase family protein n=1 Tax=Shewanella jiangmenensis TaxID=2837387 RepID=A0ABS5V2C0_9GAMM|nr:ornithine cyclodeaminase family protein [Shewanella jiangmenensis]MBT1444612.1 ornithine cyclodeaminase family protein [Shewanella jiangmenensis]
MKIITAQDVHRALDFNCLIEALRCQFSAPSSAPKRQVYPLDAAGSHDAFALLPAWDVHSIAVKAFTYLPDNPSNNPGCQSLYSQILLFCRQTGVPEALIDGTSVTYWRTAAVSALASSYLSRSDSKRLLIFGTGNLAPFMALAHAAVRPIDEIRVIGRNRQSVDKTCANIREQRPDIDIRPGDAARDVPWADIISCATGSPVPLFPGSWVSAGTHTDFVGNHHQNCRECDTELVLSAQVFVDSRINVFAEAGELLLPVQEGRFELGSVRAELSELCRDRISSEKSSSEKPCSDELSNSNRSTAPWRTSPSDITLFKSVGSALADLAAARLVYQRLGDMTSANE